MTLDQFIKKWTGKKCCLGGLCQCVALARQYIEDVLGSRFPQFPIVSGAYQVFGVADAKYYTKIRSGVPRRGDIIIWKKEYGGSGHIAIVVEADVNGILSFDQNYTGHEELPQLVNHNYNLVLGWLHPKGVSMTCDEEKKKLIANYRKIIAKKDAILKNKITSYKKVIQKQKNDYEKQINDLKGIINSQKKINWEIWWDFLAEKIKGLLKREF